MNEWFDFNEIDFFSEETEETKNNSVDSVNTDNQESEINIEEINNEIEENEETNINKLDMDNLHDHEIAMLQVIDKFEKRAWSHQTQGIKTGWDAFDKAFEGGLQTGWILIGGDSNIGKTGFISQLSWKVAVNNDDVYVLDFSLDDPMHDKIPRVVASMNKVIINAVRNPQYYTHYPKMIERRNKGIETLRNMVNRYRCFDSSVTTDIDKIEDIIREHLIYLDEKGEKKRIVVFIDNFHDLTTTAKEAQGSDKNKYDYLAQRVSDMATKFDCPIITTGEFKKINGYRRPQVDDLRESVKIKYEAKAILLCYNEVSLKGESAGIYFEKQGDPMKQPVFEVKFGKNKFSSFKGRLFFEFYPEIAYFEIADEETSKQYNNALYAVD
ncbi:MAG: DnaB helicase C-terminal domain-containing protein [Ignavibacterium sp.]|nr:DnaB helicase C-terminal domain-containing protein [Ignavibacterium sp.]